ncbi:MAG: response regulator [Candidatus Absconditicoccaceae bacterium]
MNGLEDIKILLADDDNLSCDIAKLYLKKIGIKSENIVIVNDGSAAIDVSKKQLFDLILMDIRMPGKSGIDATKEIRAHYNGNSPKIVAYSGDVFAANNIVNRELFDAFIIKPINKEIFQNPIFEVLEYNTL